MNSHETLDVFLEMETRLHLFDMEIDGAKIWPLLRIWTFTDYLSPKLNGNQYVHPDLEIGHSGAGRVHGLAHRIKDVKHAFQNCNIWLRYEPWFLSRADVVIALSTRPVPDGGVLVSPVLDYFLEDVQGKVAVIDYPPLTATDYFDYGSRAVTYRAERILRSGRVGSRVRQRMSELLYPIAIALSAEISVKYGIGCCAEDLVSKWSWMLEKRKLWLPHFRKWIRRLRPKLLVTVVHYDFRNLIFCEAAHLEGVEVAELQHGVVSLSEPAYNLPQKTCACSPDWLFAWGSYWISQTRNYALKDSLPLGYPYLEHARENGKSRKDHRATVMFISQGPVGCALANAAVALRALLPVERYRIVYRLHPFEVRSWRKIYVPLAENANVIDIISNENCSLYDCLPETDFLVGSYSTALIEGFAWGLTSFVFANLTGADIMSSFAEAGAVEFVADVKELATRLRQVRFDRRRPSRDFVRSVWQDDARRRVAEAINERIRQ